MRVCKTVKITHDNKFYKLEGQWLNCSNSSKILRKRIEFLYIIESNILNRQVKISREITKRKWIKFKSKGRKTEWEEKILKNPYNQYKTKPKKKESQRVKKKSKSND